MLIPAVQTALCCFCCLLAFSKKTKAKEPRKDEESGRKIRRNARELWTGVTFVKKFSLCPVGCKWKWNCSVHLITRHQPLDVTWHTNPLPTCTAHWIKRAARKEMSHTPLYIWDAICCILYPFTERKVQSHLLMVNLYGSSYHIMKSLNSFNRYVNFTAPTTCLTNF